MGSFLVIVGLAIALFVAFSAKNKTAALEQIIKGLKAELLLLRADLAAIRTLQNNAIAEPESAPKTAASASPASAAASASLSPNTLTPSVAPAASSDASAHTALPAANQHPIEPKPALSGSPKPAAPRPPPVKKASILDSVWVIKAKQWLFGGNLVAKIGLLILFIGVSFLLKYAAAKVTVPIELRLAGVTLADIALLIWGWRIRDKRPGISLPVQGAAMAILMLVTFGAFRMYGLIPSGLAFALLFALTGFTCLLAVLQNALWLAIFGIAGGFAAPILTSTGQGNHIGLFSYYALLNAGIFGIALHRSWRSLNLLGFVFTFLIGTTWGVLQYAPENYLSAQLFLLLFFVFYVAIAIVYASRQAPQLKNYVDGTLVFGTPLVAFGLQFGLVKHMQFGAAFSALGLGLFYMTLTLILWKKRGTTLKLLTESFFALAVVFGTLAIPFALDGRWTSAAWALEGAGIVWIGLRQRQTMAWVFGLLVQAGAWISFIFSVSGLDPAAAAQSNLWLGFLLLAATAFLMATNFRSQASNAKQIRTATFDPIATVFLALASVWFVAGAWTEIWLHSSGATQASLLVGSALIAAMGLGFIAKRMQWQIAKYFAVVVQMVAGVTLFFLALFYLDWPGYRDVSPDLFDGPFLGALMIGAGAFFSSWVFYRQHQESQQNSIGALSKVLLLWSAFWWFGLILYSLAGWAALHYSIFSQSDFDDSLFWCAYGIGLAATSPLFALLARRLQWSSLRWLTLPNWWALTIATIAMLGTLYIDDHIPMTEAWIAYLALWLSGEWLMRFWMPLKESWLKLLHTVRTVGPWLMIWPVGYHWIAAWLQGSTQQEQALLTEAGWFTSGSWARYIPAWAMMLAAAWLIRRVRSNHWPVAPIAQWYQRRLIPLAAAWSVLLAGIWNLTQNGAMAPLPYLPVLNPLDLSTCFAILLSIAAYRLAQTPLAPKEQSVPQQKTSAWITRLPTIAAIAAYVWFNLVLLRTVAQFMDIPYQFDDLFASQFVQAMLSLVWSGTALILMRSAAKNASRKHWMTGAGLLGLVVAKLFFVDLSNVGGVERIISFVGVGLLMVAIGYVAPYPTQIKETEAPPADEAVPK